MAQFSAEFLGTVMSDIASWFVYLAIAILFMACYIKCVLPLNRVRWVLRRAVRQIKQGEQSKKSWQEETFLGKGCLYAHWSEYLNNLFFADGEFHNPSSLEDFINEDTAVYGPSRSAFAEAAPGIMVSLGFLGTLLGITGGLEGFGMDDAEQVMAAIRQLVPGMQYAFYTSIVGVVASIVMTLWYRAACGSTIKALDDFYDAMNKHAGVVSVEPMTQIAIYQQEQTALIRDMAGELAGKLTERLATSLAETLKGSLTTIETHLDDFMTYTTKEQLRGVDIIVQRFIQQMNMSVNGQFEQLKITLEDTNRNQQTLNEGVRQTLEGLLRLSQNIVQLSQISDSLIKKYDDALARVVSTQKMAEDGYQRMAANVEHLDIVARQYNVYLQTLSKVQESVASLTASLENVSKNVVGQLETAAEGAAESLMGASTELRKSSDTLATNHKILVGGISKDIDRTYNTFFKSVNETIEHMQWAVEDMRNTLSQMPASVDTASNLYARQGERLTDALRRAQGALDEAVDRMTQAMYTGNDR